MPALQRVKNDFLLAELGRRRRSGGGHPFPTRSGAGMRLEVGLKAAPSRGRWSMGRLSERGAYRGLPAQQRGLLLHAKRLPVRVQVNEPQRGCIHIGQRRLPIIPTSTPATRALARRGVRVSKPLRSALFASPKYRHPRNQAHSFVPPEVDNLFVSVRPIGLGVHSNRSPRMGLSPCR